MSMTIIRIQEQTYILVDNLSNEFAVIREYRSKVDKVIWIAEDNLSIDFLAVRLIYAFKHQQTLVGSSSTPAPKNRKF